MAKSKRVSSISSLLDPNHIDAISEKANTRLEAKLEKERNTKAVETVAIQHLQVDKVYEQTIRPQKDEEAAQFSRLIEQEGIRDALIVYESGGVLYVVDGHHRLKAAHKLGIERVPIKRMPFASPSEATEWMLRNQLGRRNLTHAERINIALQLEGEIRAKAKDNMSEGGKGKNTEKTHARDEVAKLANTSPRNVSKFKKVKEEGTEELLQDVLDGKKSIHKAYGEVQEPKEELLSKPKKKLLKVPLSITLEEPLQQRLLQEAKDKRESIDKLVTDILRAYFLGSKS